MEAPALRHTERRRLRRLRAGAVELDGVAFEQVLHALERLGHPQLGVLRRRLGRRLGRRVGRRSIRVGRRSIGVPHPSPFRIPRRDGRILRRLG